MVQRKKRIIKQSTEIKKEYFFYGIGAILFISIILFYPEKKIPESVENTELKQIVKQPILTPISKKRTRLPQIEIQNGCGIEGIASKFKPVLMKAEIDVIATGNYINFTQKVTFILIHDKQAINLAISLAQKLGIDKKNIRQEIKSSPLSELTLVLGSDYGKLNTKESFN
jgi:hypothetical protein